MEPALVLVREAACADTRDGVVERDPDPLADEIRPSGRDRLTPERDLPIELVAHLRDGEQSDGVTAPSATSPSVALRPQTTTAATTTPAASATKLDCENEKSSPTQIATTAA